MSEFVSVHHGDGQAAGIATVLLSRPPTNALTRQMCRELAAAATDVAEQAAVTAVILFGGHEIFCGGCDVPELRTLNETESDGAAEAFRRAVDAVAAIPKPTVAAITGYALGGGLTLALAADWRISGDNAKFGSTEILDGLAPSDGGPARLARAIGESKAKDLVFSGRFVGAEEASAIGLVDELVAPDHVYDEARAWAERFTDRSPQVLAAAKAAFLG